jgi:tetratricopeptide (TPR) repeat protein
MTKKSIFTIALGLHIMAMNTASSAPLDLNALWDFRNPALSESRFQQALATAQGDDVLVLQTQIARTYGLRKDFAKAREILAAIEPQLQQAGPEARVRHALEWGRSFASAAHARGSVSAADTQTARVAYQRGLDIAVAAGLDGLAIDAIHMFAFVDTAPAEQQRRAEQALAIAIASRQPAAQRWEASIRNNLGVALHAQQRYGPALEQFEQALSLRQAMGSPAVAVREARWMVGWTLRALGRQDEALALQLQLEKEAEAAGQPDAYVFEELEALYRLRGAPDEAARYADKKQRTRKQTP